MNKYYFEMERRMAREGRGSPVDAEIFANGTLLPKTDAKGQLKPLSQTGTKDRLDQLNDLLKRFRKTPQTNMALEPSMSHAVVRAYLESGHGETLLMIIHDKLKFGIFPDDYALILMLDHFITKQNFRDGTKVAIDCMLQEDFSAPIVSQACLLSTFKYAVSMPQTDPEEWVSEAERVRDLELAEQEKEMMAAAGGDDDDDEKKVRVRFVDNSYHDDHFDLRERHLLVGKTLARFGEYGMSNISKAPSDTAEAVEISIQLLGYALFQKWDAVAEICNSLQAGQKVAKSCTDLITGYSTTLQTTSDESASFKEEALEKVSSLNAVEDLDVEAYLQSELSSAVSIHETSLIDKQTKVYEEWNLQRDAELQKQMELYQKEVRAQKLKEARREIALQEEELFFFDNYEQMEREKVRKYKQWRQTFPPKSGIKMPPKEVVTEDYIPPTVGKRQSAD